MSDTIQALSQAASEIGAVGKNGYNPAQRFNFRGIDDVMNAVAPAFRRYGIIATPELLDKTYEHMSSKRGGTITCARLTVAYRFQVAGSEPITATVAAEAFDSGDKATQKAMSVAYRTALLQVLCLPTCEPDPDEQTYNLADSGDTFGQIQRAMLALRFTREQAAEAIRAATGGRRDAARVADLTGPEQEALLATLQEMLHGRTEYAAQADDVTDAETD